MKLKNRIRKLFNPAYAEWCRVQAEYGRIGGHKSGEIRKLKKVENVFKEFVWKQVMEKYPEIKIISKALPELEDEFMENPEGFLALINYLKKLTEKKEVGV